MELLTCLELAQRLGFLEAETARSAFELIDHIGRMLTRLPQQLRSSQAECR